MAYIDKITAINSSTNESEVFDIKDTVSGYTTNTGTITGVTAGSGLSGGGTSGSVTLNHSNSVTAKTTQAIYPIKFDSQGHITGAGSAVTIPTVPTNVSAFTNDAGYITEADIPEGAAAYTGTPSAVSTTAAKGESNGFARGDHVHNITGTTITDALGYTPYNSTNPNGYTSNTGTVTGVKINGTTKNPTSGVVDIGTVLTSYIETDPVYSASAAAGITSSDITNWNSKTSNTGTVTGVTAGTGLKVGTNASGGTISTSGTINHINSVTAKTTQGLYPIKYDAQGHITGSGDAVTSLPASDVSAWAKADTKPTYTAAEVGAIPTSQKGANSGVAELDANGKVPSSQLPSYVDDVLEYSAKSSFPATGEAGKIYVDTSTNLTYRWSGSAYVEISPSLALGTTSSTAFRGDYGNTAYNHATDSSKLTTATSSGLYKVASTAQGHIASLTAVQKSDITALGIPAQDTTYVFDGTYDASTNKAATVSTVSNAISSAIPSAATATPLMDGTAAVGTSSKYAKEDHVHPSDSSKVDVSSSGSLTSNINLAATISNENGVIDFYSEPQSGSTVPKTGMHIGYGDVYGYYGDDSYFGMAETGFEASYVSFSGERLRSYAGPTSSGMSVHGQSEELDSWASFDLGFDDNTDDARASLYVAGAVGSGGLPENENEIIVTPTTTTIKNVVTPVDNGDAVPKSYVDGQVATKQATLVSGTNIKTINGTSLLGSGNITTPDTDNKVAQNNSTAANDFRVLLSNSVSDSSETAATNKSANLRFMPSTNHLYVGGADQDALITVSPRMHLGAFNRYDEDGSTESETSYGVGIGINNSLAYTSYFTTTGLLFQHWNASRPSGGTPSSTNYVASAGSVTHAHVLLRDYSGKGDLATQSELTSTKLSFVSSGTTYTVTPTKIDKWDNYTDTKNTAGSTNTSSKIFLVGATSQAANPVTYSHDTAYVGTNGHLYSNSKQVVNLSDTQTISNKTLDDTNIISAGTVVNNPAITSSTTSISQTTWGATTSTYTTAISGFICRRWGPVVMLYIRFTTGATGGTGTTRTFFTPADNYKPVGLYYCQVNANAAPYAQATNASFWFTSEGTLQGRAVASTEYRISCMYLLNN